MKNLINIILLTALFAQFSTNNLNGFGDNVDIASTSSESMGGMWMNNSNKNNWDPFRASSIYKTDLTIIAISSSIQGVKSTAYNVNNHYINFINFSYPIGKTMGFGIGLSPYSRADYVFEEEPNIIDGTEFSQPLQSTASHLIDGGISKLALKFSKGFDLESLNISMGFKWNILFGNQNLKTITTLDEIIYDQMGNIVLNPIQESMENEQRNHFKSYLYEVDSRVTIKNNSFSFLISVMDNFEVDRYEENEIFSYSKKYLLNEMQLDRFAVGYMYDKDNNFGIAFEGHLENSINYPEEIMIFNNSHPTKISFHNGIYKRFNNPKLGSWNSINLNVGYKYKIIKFINNDLNDISLSFGIGFHFNDWKNNIDMSFTIGSSENIVETINYDNYYKFNIAFYSGEKWFTKRRRK